MHGVTRPAASHLQDVKSLGILEEVCPTTAMISRSTVYCLGIAGGPHLQQNATLITSNVQGRQRLAKSCIHNGWRSKCVNRATDGCVQSG